MKRIMLTLCLAGVLTACSNEPPKSPDVDGIISRQLSDANLKDVSVKQDRDKGVVTLSGHVASEADKSRAESIAKAQAAGQVVANEILVTPPGFESESKTVASDLDKGIEKNLEAALIERVWKDGVSVNSKAGVVTLSGNVHSQQRRTDIEKLAASIPNVKQVVNTLQVTAQKATGRGGH